MLKKKHKLPIQLFLSLKSGSKYFKSQLFSLKIKENSLPFSRFGIVISSRYDKKAVRRNFLKRRIFDFFRLNIDKFKKGFDILAFLSSFVKSDTKEEKILEDLEFILKKSGIF